MGRWTREEVESNKRDLKNILRYLGIYRTSRGYWNHYPMEVTDVVYQSANQAGLWYPDKKPGDMFSEGEKLGKVTDYEGKTLETSYGGYDGVILFQTGSLQVTKEGPMIAYGRIAYEKDDRKEKIAGYWTKRSSDFKEQRREEQENNSLTRERVRRVLSMDEAIALLPSEQVWCEDMARLSGRGVEFAADLPQLLPSFTAFLRLRGEEHTVTGLSDAKRRFMYWMKSDEGRQAVKQLQITADAGEENDPYRYETLAGEQRTYMGRPIPADAPPRPNSWAVWDDQTEAWTR